ncbi:MAG TPA: hypothetical protein VFV05_00425 [Methylomirabilota bacterium]|nr:hypothetical protein [Methylomirabilota bacterium]
MGRHLFIVSRQSPDLYAYLSREFSSEPDVVVILDRREHDRWAGESEAGTAERRQGDRRVKTEVRTQLSTLGYAFVRID